jgi:hypothetical protein
MLAIGVAMTGSGYGAVWLADGRYVQQETYRKSVNQERVWTLEDRKEAVKNKALSEDRGLTTYEQTQIKDINEQIRSLGGW